MPEPVELRDIQDKSYTVISVPEGTRFAYGDQSPFMHGNQELPTSKLMAISGSGDWVPGPWVKCIDSDGTEYWIFWETLVEVLKTPEEVIVEYVKWFEGCV